MAAPRSTDPFPDAVAAFVAAAWLDMLVGVSFLATSVRFRAPSLDLPVALEVDRVTCAAYSKVEWCLSLFPVIANFIPRAPRAEVTFTTVAVLIVTVQALWLLPVLDARVDAVIAGKPMPRSDYHLAYAGLEVMKAAAPAAVALVALFRLGWRDKPQIVASKP